MTGLFALAVLASSCAGGGGASIASPAATGTAAPARVRTIIMVWDGLRPDGVTAADTPNLLALREAGVEFTDHHSTYPTVTMLNGSSFATGSFPKTSGFYGNTFWTPPRGTSHSIPAGRSATGKALDYRDPVFTEDYRVLTTLDDHYRGQLLLVRSLFATAQAAGMVTAAVGKSGPVFLQDLGKGGYIVDEDMVQPRGLATELQAAGIALPANIVKGDAGPDAVALSAANGDPTARAGYVGFKIAAYDPSGRLKVTARDSTDTTQGAPETASNRYMLSVFTTYILPRKNPILSVIWFRTPDNVEHSYGPGSADVHAGLRSQDARLGELMAALKALGLDTTTNILVVSDHAHSSVSGPLSLYPLRAIAASPTPPDGAGINGATSGTSAASLGAASASGFSFSGDVRSADLLTYRGFKAYDGNGCSTSAMYGLTAAGTPTQPVRADVTGALCGAAGTVYQAVSATLAAPVASFKVPAPGTLPANAIVVAANGGSDYFYVPSHDPVTIRGLIRFLQQREEYGAIFVDSHYGAIPGTLTLAQVNLENPTRRDDGQPDIVASLASDDAVAIQGKTGIEFESLVGQRGMHGSFGRTDVHNTMIASGPSFRRATKVTTPTGNVDVAPTIAHLLGLAMPQAEGRIIDEALRASRGAATPTVVASTVTPTGGAATGLSFELPTDPTGRTRDGALSEGIYTISLKVKDLTVDGKTYRYFDEAKASRR